MEEPTGIIAYYREKGTGKEKVVRAEDQTMPRRLRWLYATEKTAKRAVDRRWNRPEVKNNPEGLALKWLKPSVLDYEPKFYRPSPTQ
ncbi:hypothetical protein CDH05_09910 [Pseudomonas lactis]|nr:hypothetical protein CDH05_09910 [Pseudomonas lactis]